MGQSRVRNTIDHLRRCQQAKLAGYPVSFATDAKWLVNMAINRRAGWSDDPSCTRGSCQPVNGVYPKKAMGDIYRHLCNLSRKINTRRLIVRTGELGEWRKLLLPRIPERFHVAEDM